ncbi:hypothetical protein HYH03_007725 [Edaphochlamys debaryana]|uniref:DUF1308 domain-containing protein n=1 Tax=Edaphochlamys debaryana TaxID=47281 RepID=A0A835Y1G1_9CHLO|nr:hypothetical protein HYH03_007725 [Edaphochlamys debaryana]|eukprot:KAG2494085.1 hypothetical protein HYH03_007725 [Edaphochlamys debaryana]
MAGLPPPDTASTAAPVVQGGAVDLTAPQAPADTAIADAAATEAGPSGNSPGADGGPSSALPPGAAHPPAAAATAGPAGSGSEPSDPLLTFELPYSGNLDSVEVLPTALELKALLESAVAVARALAAARPHVANMDKLARRIRSDLDFVLRCCPADQRSSAAHRHEPAPPSPPGRAAPADPGPAAPAEAGLAEAESLGQEAAAAAAGAAPAAKPRPNDGSGAAAGPCDGPGGGGGEQAAEADAGPAAEAAGAEVGPGGAGAAAGRSAKKGRGKGKDKARGAAAGGAPAAAAAAAPLPLTPVRVQGIINNLRGFQGELLATQLAPGVVGVLRRFTADVTLPPPGPPGARGAQARAQAQATTAAAGDGGEAGAAAAVSAAEVAAAAAQVGRKRPHSAEAPPGGSGGAGVDGSADAGPPPAAAAGADGAPCPAAGGGDTTGAGAGGDGGGVVGAAGGAADGGGPSAKGPKGGGKGGCGGGKGGGGGGKGGGGGGRPAERVCVEVDVVAQGGHCWVEVKNQERFGTESVHWTGAARHVKGLRRQAQELVAVAAAPQHQRRWRAPAVVLFFPQPGGAGADVEAELRAMGVHVAVGPDALSRLPPPPPPPAATCLDVTAMCGLVSYMSHGGAYDTGVEAWAQRTVHWVDCLAAERASPLLPELAPWLAPGRPLLAAERACRQFQTLVDMHAGALERGRWAELRARLEVVDTEAAPEEVSPRCRQLLTGVLGADQVAVFGLGDARRCLTLTANGNAVRSAERQGVGLEVHLHRPVWLTGR